MHSVLTTKSLKGYVFVIFYLNYLQVIKVLATILSQVKAGHKQHQAVTVKRKQCGHCICDLCNGYISVVLSFLLLSHIALGVASVLHLQLLVM